MPTCKEMQKKLQEIYKTDEPLFIFRAKDKLTPAVLLFYKALYASHVTGPSNDFDTTNENDEFMDAIEEAKNKICDWQSANPINVRLPD